MIQTLQHIDQEFVSNRKAIELLATELAFSVVCTFDLTTKGLSGIPWENLGYKGIYLIEIQNPKTHHSFQSWIQEFQRHWLDERYKYKFVANPKKSRIEQHLKLVEWEWIPLYIGKSNKISHRVNEHIYLSLEKTTFALKLASREHLKDYKFRLSSIPVEVKSSDIILPIIERSLRNRLNPIIGRQ